MTRALQITADAPIALTEEIADRARRIIEDGTPTNTIRARKGALRYFWRWAEVDLGIEERYPVPPAVVVKFATDHLAGLDPSTDRNPGRVGREGEARPSLGGHRRGPYLPSQRGSHHPGTRQPREGSARCGAHEGRTQGSERAPEARRRNRR